MSKIAYVFDSTSLLIPEKIKNIRYEIVSLKVTLDDKDYKETELSDDQVIALLDNPKLLKSSSPSTSDFTHAYEKLLNEGYEDIVVVLLSKGVSGTFNVAKMAIDELSEEKQKHIHFIDTCFCNYGVANIIYSLLPILEDPNSTIDLVIKSFEEAVQNNKLLFTILDLKHLFYHGRLSRLSCAVGLLLRIKPVIEMQEGNLVLAHKKRKNEDIHKLFLEIVEEAHKNLTDIHLMIINLTAQDEADKFEEEVREKFDDINISHINRVGPVFLVHLGNHGYGITITGKSKK